jgi:glycosyltransferase involved in cell wall biosynthesis
MTRRFSIAVVLRNFVLSGGAERYAVEVTRRLAQKHNVTVYSQTWDPGLEKEFNIIRVPRFFIKPRWLNHLLFARWAQKLWKKGDYDRIWSHERHWKFNTCVVHCPCYKTKFLDKRQLWLYYFKCLISLRHLFYVLIEAFQFRKKYEKNLVAVSSYITRNIQLCYPKSKLNILVAPPGVNPTHLRAHAPKPEKCFEVLFVGTEFKRKGLEFALRGFAAANLGQKRLRIAGGGDSTPFLHLVRDLGIEHEVEFLGMVSHVEELYSSSHVFLFPTLIEPFGMAPLEAMAHSLPVVTSSARYNGFTEHIRENEALVLNNPHDSNEIGQALEKLIQPDVWAIFSKSALNVSQRLNWDFTAQQNEKALLR